MKNKVAVIIPMYKPSLTTAELLVLDKCYEILKEHPIYFVAPDSLEIDPLLTNKASTKIIRFADPYFKNIAGYNHLMLSNEFYQAFSHYEYILIYQLDAYIFEDDLIEWCNKGYDYIGAPWIPSQKYEQTHYKMGLHVFNFLGRLTRIKTGTHNYYQVGNGGFSLRKVDSFIKITQMEEDRISYYLSRKGARFHEDVFWGVDMVKRHKNFKVPKWKEALGFSFDVRPHLAYKYSNHKLPMGCHAWNSKGHFEFWQNHIKSHSPRHKNLVVD